MSLQEIRVTARSSAPAEDVWRLLSDARTWANWAPFDESGVEEGDGVGEVRRFRRGRRVTRERVTALEPSRRLAYELVSGVPVRDYRAQVTLTPDAGGTEIEWHSTFRTQIPGTGWIVRRALQRFISRTAEGLAGAATRPPPG
jgi:uncharacterized protein YndB with AHSA1/START domain